MFDNVFSISPSWGGSETDFDFLKHSLPKIFSEERGAVVEGKLNDKSYLIADRILAKHDENYMPPEMKKILENVK